MKPCFVVPVQVLLIQGHLDCQVHAHLPEMSLQVNFKNLYQVRSVVPNLMQRMTFTRCPVLQYLVPVLVTDILGVWVVRKSVGIS